VIGRPRLARDEETMAATLQTVREKGLWVKATPTVKVGSDRRTLSALRVWRPACRRGRLMSHTFPLSNTCIDCGAVPLDLGRRFVGLSPLSKSLDSASKRAGPGDPRGPGIGVKIAAARLAAPPRSVGGADCVSNSLWSAAHTLTPMRGPGGPPHNLVVGYFESSPLPTISPGLRGRRATRCPCPRGAY